MQDLFPTARSLSPRLRYLATFGLQAEKTLYGWRVWRDLNTDEECRVWGVSFESATKRLAKIVPEIPSFEVWRIQAGEALI